MTHKKQYTVAGSLAGAFLGGLAGGVTMLLLVPQSGENTRAKIQKKSIELLDSALGKVENTVSQMRSGLTVSDHPNTYPLTKQRQTRAARRSNDAINPVQTKNKANQNVSLASPNQSNEMKNVDNLVEQQPIADNVVNDSLGG